MFGLEDHPAAIQYSGTSLTKHPMLLRYVLGYLLHPLTMDTLCALNKEARSECWNPASWLGTIVDASKVKPVGFQAYLHWQLWPNARAVLHGTWACRNVGLLMSKKFGVWRWQLHGPSPWVWTDGKYCCVSQSPVPPQRATVRVRDCAACPLSIGLETTRETRQIARAVSGPSPAGHCFRGVILIDNRVLLCADESVVAVSTPPVNDRFLSLGLSADELTISVDGHTDGLLVRTAMEGQQWFCVAVAPEPVEIQPCWTL